MSALDPTRATLSALPASARVDLHMHSDRSDGRYAPEEVLRRCAAAGLDVIALTDHDLPCSLPAGPIEQDGRRLLVLHGTEISGCYEGTELHLLVYFPGPMPEDFRAFCRDQARGRAERYERAREILGLPGLPPADQAARDGERALTRLHLSQAIREAGHARSVREAFDLYTGDEHKSVPTVKLDFLEAIRVARAAGGLTSWAHPQLARAQAWTARFAEAGLQALEGIRPGTGKSYRKAMRRLARKHSMVMTGGSDWHGWSPQELGSFALDGQQAAPFVRRLLAA